jgi:hypothetical protein
MELALANDEDQKSVQLWIDVTLPSKIGRTTYNGHSQQVQVLDATYQQKMHVFGEIAPTKGATYDGYGAVYGGGGSIQSRNESVVLIVYRCKDGSEHSLELPSSLSPRAGGLFRFDWLNGHLICAHNISGKQAPRQLLGPFDFIPPVPLLKRDIALAIAAVLAIPYGILLVAVLALSPCVYIYQKVTSTKNRKDLNALMQSVMSGRAQN